jgi:hypothetical protein
MADRNGKAEAFHALHVRGTPLVLFNIWDAGGAKIVAGAGAKAIATSSWSVANANGFADGEHIPLALAIDNLRRIVGATDLPVTVDLESGYGVTPESLQESVKLAIGAGAVGCNLEDSFPANGKLRDTRDQADRIRRARQAADVSKIHFFLNALQSPNPRDFSPPFRWDTRSPCTLRTGRQALQTTRLTRCATGTIPHVRPPRDREQRGSPPAAVCQASGGLAINATCHYRLRQGRAHPAPA